MSVSFFELAEGRFSGRSAGRFGRTRRAGRPSAGKLPAVPGRASLVRSARAIQLSQTSANAAVRARGHEYEHRHSRDTARPWQRYLGWALTGAGAAMIPWLFVLAAELPAQTTAVHWNTVWVGLDSLEALGLASTGLLLRRQDARAGLTAAATATLLAMDAWFDVLTSAPGADRAVAIAMAAGAELPMAALCAYLAVRLYPRSAPDATAEYRAHE